MRFIGRHGGIFVSSLIKKLSRHWSFEEALHFPLKAAFSSGFALKMLSSMLFALGGGKKCKRKEQTVVCVMRMQARSLEPRQSVAPVSKKKRARHRDLGSSDGAFRLGNAPLAGQAASPKVEELWRGTREPAASRKSFLVHCGGRDWAVTSPEVFQ